MTTITKKKRALSNAMIKKLKTGVFKNIFNHIVSDADLSLEIRLSSQAIVYYKKSKILTLHSRRNEPTILNCGYYVHKPIINIDKPSLYFEEVKDLVDIHPKGNKEFSIQQAIAFNNRSLKKEFVVLDMEYQFAQELVKNRTSKNTRFDLVAYNPKKNEIVLLELKYGFASSNGKSGVVDHQDRYEEHVNHPEFRTALIEDMKTILKQKIELGILKNKPEDFPNNIDQAQIKFKIVFAYDSKNQAKMFKDKFKDSDILFVNHSKQDYTLKSNAKF